MPLPSIRSFTNLSVEKLEDRTVPAPLYVDNQILLTPRADADAGGVIAGVRATGLVDTVRPLGFGIYLATLKAGVAVTAAVPAVGGVAGVKNAGPNYKIYPTAVPNDPNFLDGKKWEHRNTGQSGGVSGADSRSTNAWDFGTGTGDTVVAIIDGGVDYNHPDLAANMWRNTGEVAGDGVDNDGNGFVDDVNGYNFASGTGDIMADRNQDTPHGTHVAGIVGAVGNNGVGVVGATWRTRLMGLTLFSGGANSGAYSTAIEAINYAATMGAKISNNSWGGGAPIDPIFQQALDGARAKGHIFVAAAGNGAYDNDTGNFTPSNYYGVVDNVVSVAAADRNDQMAGFSQWGKKKVTLGAPGVEIYSTFPDNSYGYLDGTSMASPQVTGALAAFWDANPDFTYTEVIDALKRSVRKLPAFQDKTDTGGVLDMEKLMSFGNLPVYATGAGAGGGPLVKVFRGVGAQKTSFFAYDPVFTGGVRVVTADVTGDGTADIIVAPGKGGGPHVKVYDGKTFQQLASFFAFESEFRGGLFVAARDMDGDKKAEIIVSADANGGPRVSILKPNIGPDATGATTVTNFFAYDVGFTGGVRIATGDFNGDGLADLVVAPGFGGGPHVKVFSGLGLLTGNYDPEKQFMAGDVTGRNGLFVTAGNMSGDKNNKIDSIVVGSGAGTPVVRVYNGGDLSLSVQMFPTGGEVPGLVVDGTNLDGTLNNRTFPLSLIPPAAPPEQLTPTTDKTQRQISGYLYGIRVGTHDVNNDGVADLLLAAGPADTPTVTVLNGKTLTEMRSFNAYEDFFYGGVFVGGAGDPPPKVTT